jgi:ribosome-associated translation inhibitor RaiA
MQLPLQITFRNMETSSAVEAKVREEAEKLNTYYDKIMSCRVVAEIPHKHRQRGNLFHIHIKLTVPGSKEIVIRHEPSLRSVLRKTEVEKGKKEFEVHVPHKDIYIAIREAFDEARRRLQDFARRQRGDVKTHEIAPSEEEETEEEPRKEETSVAHGAT